MGRDYIGERTIADPRMRAAEQARRRRLAAQRRAAEAAALARYKERARWCRVPGCGQPSAGGVFGFWPCCSEACMQRWQEELQRREDVAQARRLGIPVAQLRASHRAAATAAEPATSALDAGNTPPAAVPMTTPPLPHYCLIACSGTKAAAAAPAAQIYRGDLFVKSLAWARLQGCTEVAILSAKHGLTPLDHLVEPYDESLIKAPMPQRRRWAEGILASLQQRWSLATQACEITCLAGLRYTEPLIEMIQEAAPGTLIRRPLAGLGIGQQKAWLANQLRVQPAPQMPAP